MNCCSIQSCIRPRDLLRVTFASSTTKAFDELFNDEFVAENGLTGSVMDYAPVNLRPPGRSQPGFYGVKPGPYDDWAIEFGYSPALDGAEGEARRAAFLKRSTESQLVFSNDADDMRAPSQYSLLSCEALIRIHR